MRLKHSSDNKRSRSKYSSPYKTIQAVLITTTSSGGSVLCNGWDCIIRARNNCVNTHEYLFEDGLLRIFKDLNLSNIQQEISELMVIC